MKMAARFRKGLNLVRDNRQLVCLVLFTYFALVVFGYTRPHYFEDQLQSTMEQRAAAMKGMNVTEIIAYLLGGNLAAMGLSTFLGIVFLPVLSLTVNGYSLGAGLNSRIAEDGLLDAFRLLPHGMFEIPALAISLAFGLRISLCWFKRDRLANLKTAYKEALLVYFLVVLPLLVVAGTIEGIGIWIIRGD